MKLPPYLITPEASHAVLRPGDPDSGDACAAQQGEPVLLRLRTPGPVVALRLLGGTTQAKASTPLVDLIEAAARIDRDVTFRPEVLQLAEVVFPMKALIEEVTDAASPPPQEAQLNFLMGAEHVHRELLLVARFLAYGQWFSVIAALRRLLESVIIVEEALPFEAQWLASGGREADWRHPLVPAFDAVRAARRIPRLASAVSSWRELSDALHGRGPAVALWTQKEDSPGWTTALHALTVAFTPVTRAGMTYATRALAAGDPRAPLLHYVAVRGRGPTPVYRFPPEHLLAATEVLRWDQDTHELAAQRVSLSAEERELLQAVRAGKADAAGTADVLLLAVLSQAAGRAERFLKSLQTEVQSGANAATYNSLVISGLRAGGLAKLMSQQLDGRHADALATAGEAMISTSHLWADDDDLMFVGSRAVLEQTARARVWRENPSKAERIEIQPGRQRWLQFPVQSIPASREGA